MRKHLLFIFIFSLFIVSVMGQGFRTSTPSVSAMENSQYFPISFYLSEAYPNPADADTKLDYILPKESLEDKIIIRSLLGMVVNEHEIEGKQGTIIIQTSDLSGGFYFYSLMIDGNIVITRKLIVRH